MREQHLREVNIKVSKGTVTVRGPIREEAGRERVLAQISSTEGVRAINDRLTVVGKPQGSAGRDHSRCAHDHFERFYLESNNWKLAYETTYRRKPCRRAY